MERVFITGPKGFIGAHLSKYLEAQGHEIAVFRGDILDVGELHEALKESRPTVIFHLAGVSNPRAAGNEIHKTYDVNVTGTLTLLETLSSLELSPLFVFFSSSHVYGAPQALPIKEDHPAHPRNIYGRSKLIAEDAVRLFQSMGQVQSIVLRLFNHTHKSQSPEFVLPKVYKHLKDKSPTLKMGDISVRRDFNHISNLLDLAGKIVAKKAEYTGHEIFNVCSGQAFALDALISEMEKQLGHSATVVTPNEKDQVPKIYGDNIKAQKFFDWTPRNVEDEGQFIRHFLDEPNWS